MMRGLHVMRMNYPQWNSPGEIVAMVKSGIKSCGQNLILHYAAQKRQAIDKNNKGKLTSMSQLDAETSSDHLVFEYMIYSSLSLTESDESMEARLAVNQALKRYDEGSLAHKFLAITSGKYDEGFTQYLGENNEEYSDRNPFDFTLSKACKYLKVDKDKAITFLRKAYNGN
jgi:hypothetical protein